MVDTNYLDNSDSNYKTKPPNKEALNASLIKQRPAEYKQMGYAKSFTSTGEDFVPLKKPHYYVLASWDNARLKEPIIKNGIEKLALYICSKVNKYHHSNPMIEDFINANIEAHIYRWVQEASISAYWSGYSVGENIFKSKNGPNGIKQIWLDDIVNYHPTQVDFRLNDYGRLTHGEKTSYSQYLSGVWVPAPNNLITKKRAFNKSYTGGMIRLPKHKVWHVAFNASSNNPWGVSQLTAVLHYHLFKEAFRDMMAIALDRYGTPLLYAIVPPQITNELIEEADGTVRNKQYRESVTEALQDVRGNQGIVLEQLSKDYPVEIGSLTTGNNFADAFKSAIELCDSNMMVGMGIPNLIIRDERSGLGSGTSSENQVELFNLLVSHYFKLITTSFTEQVIKPLISYNFDPYSVKDADKLGHISELPLRPTELKTVVNCYKELTTLGYLNASNQEDYNHVRSTVKLPLRKCDQYAKDVSNLITKQSEIQIKSEEIDIKRDELKLKQRIATRNKPTTTNKDIIENNGSTT